MRCAGTSKSPCRGARVYAPGAARARRAREENAVRLSTSYANVYDLTGRRVRTLVQGARNAGPHVVVWDGRDHQGERVASGVYVYRLQSAGRERTRQLVVLK